LSSLLGPNILNTVQKTLSLMFFPESERPGFTSIQYNWQNYSLDILILEMGKQKILDRIIASIP
jgi:hypothetical protein